LADKCLPGIGITFKGSANKTRFHIDDLCLADDTSLFVTCDRKTFKTFSHDNMVS
jgi:hypothetical protein